MEPQRDSSSYSPKRNIANSYRTADKYPENVSREDSSDKHVTERKYILQLEFVRTYDGVYVKGSHIDLNNYTVALMYSDGSFKAVTRECRYNLGSEEVVIGGIVLKPNDGNPEHYTFTGYDPKDLVAFYTTIEGRELMATTPLYYGMDLRDWQVAPRADISVTYTQNGFNIFVHDLLDINEWLYKEVDVLPYHDYIFEVTMSTLYYEQQSETNTTIYITSSNNRIENHYDFSWAMVNQILAQQVFDRPHENANYKVQFNSGDNNKVYLIFDFTPMVDEDRTNCTIHKATFYEVQ